MFLTSTFDLNVVDEDPTQELLDRNYRLGKEYRGSLCTRFKQYTVDCGYVWGLGKHLVYSYIYDMLDGARLQKKAPYIGVTKRYFIEPIWLRMYLTDRYKARSQGCISEELEKDFKVQMEKDAQAWLALNSENLHPCLIPTEYGSVEETDEISSFHLEISDTIQSLEELLGPYPCGANVLFIMPT